MRTRVCALQSHVRSPCSTPHRIGKNKQQALCPPRREAFPQRTRRRMPGTQLVYAACLRVYSAVARRERPVRFGHSNANRALCQPARCGSLARRLRCFQRRATSPPVRFPPRTVAADFFSTGFEKSQITKERGKSRACFALTFPQARWRLLKKLRGCEHRPASTAASHRSDRSSVAEHLLAKLEVVGSIPSRWTKRDFTLNKFQHYDCIIRRLSTLPTQLTLPARTEPHRLLKLS